MRNQAHLSLYSFLIHVIQATWWRIKLGNVAEFQRAQTFQIAQKITKAAQAKYMAPLTVYAHKSKVLAEAERPV